MLALNRTTIDFFSLDVEGAEHQVLKTVDFNKINIRTMTVEVPHQSARRKALTSFLTEHGMKVYKSIGTQNGVYARDIFYIKNDMSPIVQDSSE